MKRKPQAPSLFDDMPSEDDGYRFPTADEVRALRGKPAPVPIPPTLTFIEQSPEMDGREYWIQCRAAVLVKIRGMTPGSARALAVMDFEDTLEVDNES